MGNAYINNLVVNKRKTRFIRPLNVTCYFNFYLYGKGEPKSVFQD